MVADMLHSGPGRCRGGFGTCAGRRDASVKVAKTGILSDDYAFTFT